MLLWQGSIVEIDYGFFRVVGPYFVGKSLGTSKILIFGLWSFILMVVYTKRVALLVADTTSGNSDSLCVPARFFNEDHLINRLIG